MFGCVVGVFVWLCVLACVGVFDWFVCLFACVCLFVRLFTQWLAVNIRANAILRIP